MGILLIDYSVYLHRSRMISQEYEMSEVLEAVRFIHPHASLHSVGQLVDQINEQKRCVKSTYSCSLVMQTQPCPLDALVNM